MDKEEKIPKRRGRKPKKIETIETTQNQENIIIEETNSDNTPTTKKTVSIVHIIAIALLLVLIVIISVTCIYLITDRDLFNKKDKEQAASNIELKYTETVDSKVEGVYITDVSNVVENVMPSIVAITSKTLINSGMYGPSFFNEETYSTGAGSGIIVSKTDKELLILTNNHVVEGASSLSVQFINEKSIDATIKGASSARDLAIISISLDKIDEETANAIKIATMGDSTKLKVGNGVIAIGNALGYGQSVTTGVISALNRTVSIDNMKNSMIQIDAAINGGNSGGALLNSVGEVIGINSAKYSSSAYTSSASIEGMGFAIPISDVSKLIEQLMNGETLADDERGYLGVSGYMNDEETAKETELPVGFYVTEVVKGGASDKAGIQQYDIITKIEEKDVTSFAVIEEVLATKKAGEKVKLTITYQSRNGKYKTEEVTVTLSSFKEVN